MAEDEAPDEQSVPTLAQETHTSVVRSRNGAGLAGVMSLRTTAVSTTALMLMAVAVVYRGQLQPRSLIAALKFVGRWSASRPYLRMQAAVTLLVLLHHWATRGSGVAAVQQFAAHQATRVRQYGRASAQAAGRFIEDKAHTLHVRAEDKLRPLVHKWILTSLDLAGPRVLAACQDEYMPQIVKDLLRATYDEMLPIVKARTLVAVDDAVRRNLGVARHSRSSSVIANPHGTHPVAPVRRRSHSSSSLASSSAEPSPVNGTSNNNNHSGGAHSIAQLAQARHAHSNSIVDVLRSHEWREWPSAIRAYVLYALYPCDRSTWWCYRSKRWWTLTIVGLLPMVGQLWWVMLFLLRDLQDEFQLTDFIVSFEASKFVSVGLWSLVYGAAWMYFDCMMSPTSGWAHHSGPGVTELDAIAFVIQIIIVWTSFWRLPKAFTRRRVASEDIVDSDALNGTGVVPSTSAPDVSAAETAPPEPTRSSAGAGAAAQPTLLERLMATHTKGGALRRMTQYTTSIVLVIVISVILAWLACADPWKLSMSLYWIRCMYGLLSLPFTIFKVPVLSQLLLPANRTGYNRRGVVVVWRPHS